MSSSPPEVEWCDPPSASNRVWEPLLTPLMERPGAWAIVRRYPDAARARDAANSLRRAARGTGRTAIPPGRWDFVSRRAEPGSNEFAVLASFVGPEGDA